MDNPLDPDKVNALKELLLETDDMARLWDYFFTHIAAHPMWYESGVMREDSTLEGIVARIVEKHLNINGRTFETITREIKSLRFQYGVSQVGSHSVGYFYFDDIDAGSLSVASANGSRMRYARFSLLARGCGERTFQLENRRMDN